CCQVMQVIDLRTLPGQCADLPAQADAKSQQHDQRLAHGRQRGSVPVAQVDAQMTAKHSPALPGESGQVWVHGLFSEARARKRSSRVGGRTSESRSGKGATKG